MRAITIGIFLFIVFGCTIVKNQNDEKSLKYAVVDIKIKKDKDTTIVNELRFYKIQSSIDASVLMYNKFGKWDLKIKGKHQANMNRIVWENLKIFEGSKEKFTVITDGTETMNDYYTCFIIFDEKGENCLNKNHPRRKKIIDYFNFEMKRIKRSKKVYKLFY